MFSKVALFAAASMAAFVAATPVPGNAGGSCNTESMHCCNQTYSSQSSEASFLKGLLGIDVGDVTALIGINCSPITAVGLGGNSCSKQPVCCSKNNFNGLIVVGCTPINA